MYGGSKIKFSEKILVISKKILVRKDLPFGSAMCIWVCAWMLPIGLDFSH